MVNRVQILLKRLAKAFVLALFFLPVFAVDPVTVTVDPQSIAINQTVNVSFTFTQSGVQGFNFPRNTRDYDVVASSTSSNISVINGQVSQNKTSSYVIRPLHEGNISIPAVVYNYNNQQYATQAIQITVTPVANQPAQNQAAAASPIDADMNPIVVNSASTYSPYVNQQFLIKTKIYHRGNVRGLSLSNLQIDHMNIKRLDQAKEYKEMKNGLEYMVYEVDYLAFPLISGPITIPEYDVTARVIQERTNSRGQRMDPFTFMNLLFEERDLVIKAPPININVKSIPSNAPKGFSGYVGSLAVNHQVDKLEINSGDAITIKTNAYGSGNPKNLSFDFFEKSQLYSIYKDKENLNKEINQGYEYFGLNSTAAIIPERKSGRIKIKTKPLISFNPFSRKFEKHGEEEFEVFVKPSADTASENGSETALDNDEEAKIVQEEFKKELSIYSIAEIFAYKSWKNFDSSYLIIFLLLLNIVYFIRFTLRRVKFDSNEDRINYNELAERIKKAKELEEVSSIIKDIEKEIPDNLELKSRFNNFTTETDKYNYGFANSFDETKFKELKDLAIQLIKELKVNA
jgi:hypothetical protein